MSKFTERFERPAGAPSTGIGLFDARVSDIVNRSHSIGLNPQWVVTSVGLLFIALLGWVQFHTSARLNFEYVYLFGCAVAGWIGGPRSGLACAVPAAAMLLVAELARNSTESVWLVVFNSAVRLLAFGSISWLAAEVGRSTRDLHRAVEQRTARLQHELKEHKQTAEMLVEAMEVFKQVTENIADVFWVTDPSKSQVEYVSPEFEELWGRSC